MNMKIFAIVYFVIIKLQITLSSTSIIITKGPQDTTVCMNAIAECDCGFAGADPYFAIPNWRIVLRSDDGSIISNSSIDGDDIDNRLINDLQWSPDLTSGDNNAPNSKLLVGPVNMTHNQSSYQCIFNGVNDNSVISNMGTMTVVDPLSVIINVDEICTTSIAITLNTINHQTCGDVSHNVTISDNATYRDIVGGPVKYAINELHSDSMYYILVTSTHNGSSQIVNKPVRTFSPKIPNSIDVKSIEIEEINNNSCRLTWKPPVIEKCSMLPVQYYDVKIISSDGEIISMQNDNATTLMFEHLENQSNITFTVNITVIDIKGLRSASSVVVKTIYSNGTNSKIESADETNNSSVTPIIIAVIVAVIVIGLSVLNIIIITYWKYRHLHKSHDITLGKKTEDNSYIEVPDESKNHDVASPNNNEDETAHEPLTSNDDELVHSDNIDEDDSTPPIPPKQPNYAEIQLTNEMPKCIRTDHHVAYAETKPA